MTLEQLNHLPPAQFIQTLAGIFEHSPWVAAHVVDQRPFPTVPALHHAMVSAVKNAGEAAQLALIRAHPELAGKAAMRGELTEDSTREQQGAGLHLCSPDEFAQIQTMNTHYREKFGFPFIIAVRDHTRQSVIAALTRRCNHTLQTEQQECLQQIYRIAQLRLASLFAPATA